MISTLSCSKRDIEDLLALVGSLSALAAILPFAIYRFYSGEFTLGIVDSFIAIVLMIAVVKAWQRKNVENINMLLTLSYMGGLIAVLHIKGGDLFYWIYPAIAATYAMVSVKNALSINVLCIIATFPILSNTVATKELFSMYPTLILVCIFGYVFSARAEFQKKQLAQLATEDALTHTENRRSLDIKLNEIVDNNSRNSQSISMLMLDLDHFKKINDTHGHTIGDKILINFADLVKSNIRVTDRLYRFGGEEFILIANNTDLQSAGKLGEFIRKLIEHDPILGRYSVTVSIGVSEITDLDDRDTWLHRTDVALYEAKESGRNRTCIARPDKASHTYTFENISYFLDDAPSRPVSNSVISLKSYAANKKPGHARERT